MPGATHHRDQIATGRHPRANSTNIICQQTLMGAAGPASCKICARWPPAGEHSVSLDWVGVLRGDRALAGWPGGGNRWWDGVPG
jgi:hypothetical protein